MSIRVPPSGNQPIAGTSCQVRNKVEVPVIQTMAAFQKEVLEASGPVLVKFSVALCGACQDTKPHIEEIANRYGEKIKVVEVELAFGKNSRDINVVGHTYKILDKKDIHTGEIAFEGRGMPTLSLFVNGTEVERFNFTQEHFQNFDNLVELIEKSIIQTALSKSGI